MRFLLERTPQGPRCPAGPFHLDPQEPVARAVITHAHSDHATQGSQHYVCAKASELPLRQRLGPEAVLETHDWGERFRIGDATLSFHPAGHILGSAQVRIEAWDQVWVVTGDFKRQDDPTCEPFEPLPCDVLVTESTFGLPTYDWAPTEEIARDVLAWWDGNVRAKRPSLLFAYAMGKSQRLLAELARLTDREVYVHGAVHNVCETYRAAGVTLLPTRRISEEPDGRSYAGELVLAPPTAFRSPWMRRFKNAETALASGWMQVRGIKRRRGFDRGFVLSDHAGWSDLLRTVEETNPGFVIATHGYADTLAKYLNENGRRAGTAAILPKEGAA